MVERVFEIFDADKSNGLSRTEFVRFMSITGKSAAKKVKLLFQIYDKNGES